MKKEIWKPIPGYIGEYEISSHGNVKRLDGYSISKRKGYKDCKIFHKEIVLKTNYSKKGYKTTELLKHNGERMVRKHAQVHRLVALVFIGDPPKNKNQVNHKNGIKDDNYYENLEWCNNSENQIHARQNGLRPENKKSWDYEHSLSVDKLDCFSGDILNTYGSFQEAQRETGIPHQNIRKVCKGERNTAGGYSWQYSSIKTKKQLK